MIYMLGMSHAIGILDAFAGPNNPFAHHLWWKQGQSTFQEIKPAGDAPCPAPFPAIHANILSPNFGHAMLPYPAENGDRPREYVSGRYVRMLRSISREPGTVLLTSIHGNEHSLLSMVQHPVPYDFVLPWKDTLGVIPGRQILAYPVVVSQLNHSLKYSTGVFRAIRLVRPDLRVIQVMPPPPIPSEEQILKSQEPLISPNKRKNYGLTPVSIRLKYYLLYVHVLTDFLKRLNVATLLAPREAVGPDGALREPYWFGATHGNTDYGRLVLGQICDAVKPSK